MLCLSHPIVLMRNRSTGYLQPVGLCTRPVDTGHFLMHHPKWSVATGSKTTCYRLMHFVDWLVTIRESKNAVIYIYLI